MSKIKSIGLSSESVDDDQLISELNTLEDGYEQLNINLSYSYISVESIDKIVQLCNDNEILKKILQINITINNIRDRYYDFKQFLDENLRIHFCTNDIYTFNIICVKYPNYVHIVDTIKKPVKCSDFVISINSLLESLLEEDHKPTNVMLKIKFHTGCNCSFKNTELDDFDNYLNKFFEDTQNKFFLKCNLQEIVKIEKKLFIKIQKFNDFSRFSCVEPDTTKGIIKKIAHASSYIESIKSINTIKYESIYNFFFKNYKKSLFLPYKKEEDLSRRAELYMTSIIEYLFKLMLVEKYNLTTVEFVRYLISKSLHFKESVQLESVQPEYGGNDFKPIVPNNTYFSIYHGLPTDNIIEVPNNCIICFLTQINYLKYIYPHIILNTLQHLSLSTFPKTFKQSPHCYSQNADAKIFENSNTFLPGQYYNDIELYWNNKELDGNLGTYLFTYKGDDTLPLVRRYSKITHITKTTPKIKLSKLIEKLKMSGIIIVCACRSLELKTNTDITTNIYRYEHFSKILNKSTWFYDNPENYYKCGPKIIKDYNLVKESDYRSIPPEIKLITNPIKDVGNRSLGFRQNIPVVCGLSEEVLKILFDTATMNDTKDNSTKNNKILDAFTQLDLLFTTQTYNPVLLEKLKIFFITMYNHFAIYDYYTTQIARNLKGKFNIIDLFVSFILYMCAVKNVEFYKTNFAPANYVCTRHIILSGCHITTEDLEKIIKYLLGLEGNYIKTLQLENNNITKIPLELNYVVINNSELDNINLDNNELDFNVDSSNPDKYLHEFLYIDELHNATNYYYNLLNLLKTYYTQWKTDKRTNNNNWQLQKPRTRSETGKRHGTRIQTRSETGKKPGTRKQTGTGTRKSSS